MKRLILVALVALLPGMAMAHGKEHKCFSPPFKDPPSLQIVQLTDLQSAFLKGLWAGNPDTPTGLPYGDSAAWIMGPSGGAVAFFMDGEARCDALILDKEAVDLTMDIARGVAPHAGESN